MRDDDDGDSGISNDNRGSPAVHRYRRAIDAVASSIQVGMVQCPLPNGIGPEPSGIPDVPSACADHGATASEQSVHSLDCHAQPLMVGPMHTEQQCATCRCRSAIVAGQGAHP